MRKNTYPGKFIIFEGLDGSGQSTQADILFDYLEERKQKRKFGHTGVHLTKEPTPSLIGGLIRGQLSHDWKSNPECLQLLFAADRLHHLEREVIPLLERGITVISDRYFFSSIAYGGVEIRDTKWLFEINENVLLPDLTFLLKVSPKVCIQRITESRHGFTLFEKEKMLEEVSKNYAALAKKYKTTYVVNGEKPIDRIAENIQAIYAKNIL